MPSQIIRAPKTVREGPTPMRTATRIPKGPREIQRIRKPTLPGGPGEPPPGFVTPTTSATEWIMYWALAKIFKNPQDPRQGPFQGGLPDWEYQAYALGGRSRAGGAVIDFLVRTPPGGFPIGLRVVTEYFHVFAPSNKQASDEIQKELLSREYIIVDVLDTDLTRDKSGQAAVIAVKRALNMVAPLDPVKAGTAQRNRPLKLV